MRGHDSAERVSVSRFSGLAITFSPSLKVNSVYTHCGRLALDHSPAKGDLLLYSPTASPPPRWGLLFLGIE